MKISELITELNKITDIHSTNRIGLHKDNNGDLEVVMTSTILKEGYSRNNGIEEVFESCVSSLKVLNSKKEDFLTECNKQSIACKKKVLKLFWQS